MARKRYYGDPAIDAQHLPFALSKLRQTEGNRKMLPGTELYSKRIMDGDVAIHATSDKWGNQNVSIRSLKKEEARPVKYLMAVNSDDAYAFFGLVADSFMARNPNDIFDPGEAIFKPFGLVVDTDHAWTTAPPNCIPFWNYPGDTLNWSLRTTWRDHGWFFRWNGLIETSNVDTCTPVEFYSYTDGNGHVHHFWVSQGHMKFEYKIDNEGPSHYGTEDYPPISGHPFEGHTYPKAWVSPIHSYLEALPPTYSFEGWGDADTIDYNGTTMCRLVGLTVYKTYAIDDWVLAFYPGSDGTFSMFRTEVEEVLDSDSPPTWSSMIETGSSPVREFSDFYVRIPFLLEETSGRKVIFLAGDADVWQTSQYSGPSDMEPILSRWFGGNKVSDNYYFFVVPLISLTSYQCMVIVKDPTSSEFYQIQIYKDIMNTSYRLAGKLGENEEDKIDFALGLQDDNKTIGILRGRKFSGGGITCMTDSEIEGMLNNPSLNYPEINNFLTDALNLPRSCGAYEDPNSSVVFQQTLSASGEAIVYPNIFVTPASQVAVWLRAGVSIGGIYEFDYSPTQVDRCFVTKSGVTIVPFTQNSFGSYSRDKDIYQVLCEVRRWE